MYPAEEQIWGQREAKSDIASKTPSIWKKHSELRISTPTLQCTKRNKKF